MYQKISPRHDSLNWCSVRLLGEGKDLDRLGLNAGSVTYYMWYWGSYLTSPGFCFLICKMGLIPTSWISGQVGWEKLCVSEIKTLADLCRLWMLAMQVLVEQAVSCGWECVFPTSSLGKAGPGDLRERGERESSEEAPGGSTWGCARFRDWSEKGSVRNSQKGKQGKRCLM